MALIGYMQRDLVERRGGSRCRSPVLIGAGAAAGPHHLCAPRIGDDTHEMDHSRTCTSRPHRVPLAHHALRRPRARVPLRSRGRLRAVAAREHATPFDVPDVELGHHGARCSSRRLPPTATTLDDPALVALAGDRARRRYCGPPRPHARVRRSLRRRDGLSGNQPRRPRQHGAAVSAVRRALRLLPGPADGRRRSACCSSVFTGPRRASWPRRTSGRLRPRRA